MDHDAEPTNDGSSLECTCLVCGRPVILAYDLGEQKWIHE